MEETIESVLRKVGFTKISDQEWEHPDVGVISIQGIETAKQVMILILRQIQLNSKKYQ